MVQHISFDENRTTLEFFTYIHCVGCNFLRGPPRVTMYTDQGNGTRSETGSQSHHQLTSGEKVTALPARDGKNESKTFGFGGALSIYSIFII